MRRRVTVALMALAPFRLLADEGPLRVTATMVGTLVRGESATVTWTVAGTTEPVRLLLRNTSPAVGSVEGGDVQLATTSGGTPNTLSRHVTGRMPGQFSVDVKIDPGRNATREQIVADFQRELQRIAGQVEDAMANLPVERTGLLQRSTVRLDDVMEVLDRTEADLRLSLPYRELAAFQDVVTAFLESFRHEVVQQACDFRSDAEIALVARRSSEERLLHDTARRLGAAIGKWLRDLGKDSPIRTLCVQTIPVSEADVVLYPESVPADRHSARTAEIKTLYLGRYVTEVRRDGYLASKGFADILLNTQRTLQCPLRRSAGESQQCRLLNQPAEPCR